MTEPQVWVLIALFAGMLATISTLFIRVVRTEIGGLRNEMRAEISGLRGEMIARFETVGARFEKVDARIDARCEAVEARFEAVEARFEAIDVRFDHLDRDVAALSKRLFGADQP